MNFSRRLKGCPSSLVCQRRSIPLRLWKKFSSKKKNVSFHESCKFPKYFHVHPSQMIRFFQIWISKNGYGSNEFCRRNRHPPSREIWTSTTGYGWGGSNWVWLVVPYGIWSFVHVWKNSRWTRSDDHARCSLR